MKSAHQPRPIHPSGTAERRRRARSVPDGEPTRSELVSMIIGNFREMPGMSLHLHQAARLFGIKPATCRIVLDDLVRHGRLRKLTDGQYASVN
jgi:hypothetical protein